MREVITYVAFDDTEFNTKTACEEYEAKIWGFVREFLSKITLYNKKRREATILIYDLEVAASSIDHVYFECSYIRITAPLSIDCAKWFYNQFGIVLPDGLGMFAYDFDTDEWCESGE